MERCQWANGSELEKDYHDQEWGVPLHDEQLLFEFLCLEGAQAGLSWSTILNKREGYREAFDQFNLETVSQYTEEKKATLKEDTRIVRNKLKINATVTNAQAFLAVQKEFGTFDAYIWGFVGGQPLQNQWKTVGEVPAETAESQAMSKDLKKRGFKFVGPTICYALMQATGMVNDHTTNCFRHSQLS